MKDDRERCPRCKSTDYSNYIGWLECHSCGYEWSVPLEDIEETYPVKFEQNEQDK